MNQQERFDELTRELVSGSISRGRMLKMLGGAALGGVLGSWGLVLGAEDAGARRRKKKKRLPTVESLAKARAQIEAGATNVALSPDGYFRYRRTFIFSGASVDSEELLEGGKPVLTWEHVFNSSYGYGDADRDGFAESRIKVQRGGKGGVTDEWMTIEQYSPQTQALVRRQTYTRTATDTIHVLREHDDGTGNLVKEAEFDTTPVQTLTTEHLADAATQAAAGVVALAGTGCTAADEKDIRDRLDEAIVKGFTCMRKNGLPELGTKVASLLGRKLIINCVSEPKSELVAELNWWDGTMGGSELEITVNLSRYAGYVPETQRGVLWHEVLHAHFGAHDLSPPARNFETDQTYACQSLCFPSSMKPGSRTKCSCARCLGTDKCDKRCAIYDDCDADMGSGYSVKCTCPPPKTEECNGKCMDPCPAGKNRNPSSCQCADCKPWGNYCSGDAQCCSGECCNAQCCAEGETCCTWPDGFSACVDTSTNPHHCGGCNNRCPELGICSGGSCECPGNRPKLCPSHADSSNPNGYCCYDFNCCGKEGYDECQWHILPTNMCLNDSRCASC